MVHFVVKTGMDVFLLRKGLENIGLVPRDSTTGPRTPNIRIKGRSHSLSNSVLDKKFLNYTSGFHYICGNFGS